MFLLKNVKYKDIVDIENLTIQKGKVTCIVGPSGSGKTTLLRLLNKMISSDSGEIYLEHKLLEQIDSIVLRRQVVMLPQSPAIFKGSIKDNLLIGRKFSEKPVFSDDQLTSTMKLIKLKKDLTENPETLSGGEKQRLALARIILMEPDVLLLDEPSSALDENTENMIIEELVKYTKDHNKTLIMVTHSKNAANHFSDDIVEMENGRIISQREVLK